VTSLEDKLRRAFHSRASQIPPGFAPPLRLPTHSRRSFPLVHGGGQRRGAPGRRRWLAPAASAVLVVAVIAGSVAISRVVPGHRQGTTAATSSGATAASRRNSAAVWVAAQVSRADNVACDPVMCRALEARGFPADRVVVLGGRTGLPAAQVVLATSTVRGEIGDQLGAGAPEVIASFGSGSGRIEVRVVAPDGAAAYRLALSQDVTARKSAGAELAGSTGIRVSGIAREQLRSGQVASQIMIVLSGMATTSTHPLSIVSFGDSGPGAGASGPLRAAELTVAPKVAAQASATLLRQMLAFLQAQQAPYRPALAEVTTLPDGRPALRLQFCAPSPLGLFDSPGS
jgi:hypothetical protein